MSARNVSCIVANDFSFATANKPRELLRIMIAPNPVSLETHPLCLDLISRMTSSLYESDTVCFARVAGLRSASRQIPNLVSLKL